MKRGIAILLCLLGLAAAVVIQYKISDKRKQECIDKGGHPVVDFYEMFERCVY